MCRQNEEMQNLDTYFLIGMKASIYVYRDVEYHTRSCSSHGPVIINTGQPFTLGASNSAPIAHFSKRPQDTP